MLSDMKIWVLIIGMGIVTYVPRMMPLLLFSQKKLPSWLESWLRYIPVGIFSALVFPAIFIKNQMFAVSINNIELISSIIVFAIAFKTRSLGLSVIFGIISYWILGEFIIIFYTV